MCDFGFGEKLEVYIMYELNYEVREWNSIANMVELITHPFFCVSCGRPVVIREGKVPVKCPHCGKYSWED